VTAVLATLLAIAVIGLVISVMIIVFFMVQRKQSRCVITIVSLYVVMASCCCRSDDQSSMRYSEVKKSVSGSNTITDSKHIKPSEPEYETITADPTLNVKLGYDVKMDANPAYQATS